MSLAIVAGQGRLPHLVARAFPEAHVTALAGFAPEGLGPVETFRIETLGSFIAGLAARGVERVCFAGAVRRPPLDSSQGDKATRPLVPRLSAAMGEGDDGALRVVLALFEDAGIFPVGAHELVPEVLPEAGVLTGEVKDAARADAARAADVLSRLGAADVGQGCVVSGGQVLAVEAAPGTDWMLASLAAGRAARDGALSLTGARMPQGGLLLKSPKPGQDRRVDLPAVGPGTIALAAGAGLDGIVIEAGGVMLLDAEETLEAARALGLFVWVREPRG